MASTRKEDIDVSLDGVKVAVVCMYYWPEQSGSAPYVTGMAEHYATLGADVRVIAAVPHYPEWAVAEAYAGRLASSEHHRGVLIHRWRPYVPDRQSVARRAAYEASWLVGSLPRALRTTADVVVASSPPLSAAFLGHVMGRRNNVPVGVVVQDFYGNAASQSGVAGAAAASRRIAAAEAALLRSMDLVGVIDEGFVGTAHALGVDQVRIRTLPNWTHIDPPRASREDARRRLGWTDEDVVVVHTGNMGHKQGLENVIEAARITARESPRSLFVLVGDGNQRALLEERARGVPRVRFSDPVPAEDYPDLLNAADALLVNERPEAVEMSLPSKITSYLATDRPIIAAVPDGVTRRYLTRLGAAHIVPAGAPRDLADAVRGLPVGGARRGGPTSPPAVQTGMVEKDGALRRYQEFAEELLASSVRLRYNSG